MAKTPIHKKLKQFNNIPLDYNGRPLTWAPIRRRIRRSRSFPLDPRVVRCLVFIMPQEETDKNISIPKEDIEKKISQLEQDIKNM